MLSRRQFVNRKILDDHGLKCPSVHFTMQELRTSLNQAIACGKQLGIRQVSTDLNAPMPVPGGDLFPMLGGCS